MDPPYAIGNRQVPLGTFLRFRKGPFFMFFRIRALSLSSLAAIIDLTIRDYLSFSFFWAELGESE